MNLPETGSSVSVKSRIERHSVPSLSVRVNVSYDTDPKAAASGDAEAGNRYQQTADNPSGFCLSMMGKIFSILTVKIKLMIRILSAGHQ